MSLANFFNFGSFRTRSRERDDATDLVRYEKIEAVLAKIAHQIESERAGLQRRRHEVQTSGAMLFGNEYVRHPSEIAENEDYQLSLEKEYLQASERIQQLSSQLAILNETTSTLRCWNAKSVEVSTAL